MIVTINEDRPMGRQHAEPAWWTNAEVVVTDQGKRIRYTGECDLGIVLRNVAVAISLAAERQRVVMTEAEHVALRSVRQLLWIAHCPDNGDKVAVVERLLKNAEVAP